jgi:nicotinic acid phosphoribosyltransferase
MARAIRTFFKNRRARKTAEKQEAARAAAQARAAGLSTVELLEELECACTAF